MRVHDWENRLEIARAAAVALLLVLAAACICACTAKGDASARDAEATRQAALNSEAQAKAAVDEMRSERARKAAVSGTVRRKVADSAIVPTASQLIAEITERGLNDGAEGLDALYEAAPEESVPHFHFSWTDGNGVSWNVFFNEGFAYAVPFEREGRMLKDDRVLSEGASVIMFDSQHEEYVEVVGATDSYEVETVDRVDSSTLTGWARENLPVQGQSADGGSTRLTGGGEATSTPGEGVLHDEARAPDAQEGEADAS